MDSLKLRVPPDVVALVVMALEFVASRVGPPLPFGAFLRFFLGAIFLAAGIWLIIAARLAFSARDTSWSPSDPSRATELVEDGVYAYSRNPMYLGSWLGLLGLALILDGWLTVLVSSAYVVWIDRLQIAPEEVALRERFGERYEAYLERVRRWA